MLDFNAKCLKKKVLKQILYRKFFSQLEASSSKKQNFKYLNIQYM